MFCRSCGTELAIPVNYCSNCGLPQKEGLRTPTQPKVEYRQEFLNWAKTPMFSDIRRKPPHEESSAVAGAMMDKRVLREISPLLEEGWFLDGPFEAAVKWHSIDKTSSWWGSNRRRYDGCWVKLRRIL
jgi:hypothetical protein